MAAKAPKISHAFWEGGRTGLIILSKNWQHRDRTPPLWLEPEGCPLETLEPVSPEECGRYHRYHRNSKHWVFVLQSKRHPQLLNRKVRVYLGASFNGWEAAVGDPDWELKPVDEAAAETNYVLRVPLGRFPGRRKHQFKFVTENNDWLDVPDSAPNLVYDPRGIRNFEFNPLQSGRHMFRFHVPESVRLVGNEKIVWRDGDFEETHELPHTRFLTQTGTDLSLGALPGEGRTVFRIFAPRASGVRVRFADNPEMEEAREIAMRQSDGVVWEASVTERLDGWFYFFHVDGESREGTSHFDGAFPVLDPYAKACVGHRGPGIIVPEERMPKTETPFRPAAWHDLVILEAHVRDLAAKAPVPMEEAERLGYAGVRRWLREEGGYLREIGVNAVELQPVQEFDNRTREEYHWGYMTVNYFSPESSYAREPEKASQIEEFRGLVEDFHAAGMAVILDVVYNHVGEPNHLLFIDKYYYFHLDEANDLVNWSGCGNDLRCDTPMARRLILESLRHLVEVYDVDGFRFDLAELIGIEVLREIETELKKVKPSLVLIAEPWSFRGHIQDSLRETCFASWNDGFRDGVAEYVCGRGNQDMIRYFLSGSPDTSRFAAQTINYTESHDDHCWLDRITEQPEHDGTRPTLADRRRTHLMAAVLFGAIGVPMLAEGQDFLRSKAGVGNTYQRGDLNALDYDRRLTFAGTHDYFRAWIRFRLSDAGRALRCDGALPEDYVRFFFADGLSSVVAWFNHDRRSEAAPLVLALNPHAETAEIPCSGLPFDRYRQIADHERFAPEGLSAARFEIREAALVLPPGSCGLWIARD